MFDEIRVREMGSRTEAGRHSVVAKVVFGNGKFAGPEIAVHVMVELDPSSPLEQVQRALAEKAIAHLKEASRLGDSDMTELLRLGMRGSEDRRVPFRFDRLVAQAE